VKKFVVWIAIALVVGVVGFLALKPAGGLKNVDAAGVTAAQAKGAQVVDVRSGGEFELGHIPGAINVPVEEVQALKKQYTDKVEFRVLNVETDAEAVKLAEKLGVAYVPTFVFVNTDGAVSKTVVGEQTKQQLTDALDLLK